MGFLRNMLIGKEALAREHGFSDGVNGRNRGFLSDYKDKKFADIYNRSYDDGVRERMIKNGIHFDR